jgi:hypothetical protein
MKPNSFTSLMILATFACAPVYGQSELPGNDMSITVSYYGETITRPGLLVGVALPLGEWSGHELNVPIEAGFYVHVRNHTGIFLGTGIAYRYRFEAGFHLDTKLTVGGMLSIPAAPLYGVTDGRVEALPLMAFLRIMPSFGIGCGWDFRGSGLPIDAFVGFHVFGEYPFNSYLLPHLAVTTGVSYFPNNGGAQ